MKALYIINSYFLRYYLLKISLRNVAAILLMVAKGGSLVNSSYLSGNDLVRILNSELKNPFVYDTSEGKTHVEFILIFVHMPLTSWRKFR